MTDLIGRLATQLAGQRFDHIVGIPRGGLIVAAALAYRLGVTRVAAHGQDYHRPRSGPPFLGVIYARLQAVPGDRILLVEDGTDTGTLLDVARCWYAAEHADVTTAALWVLKDSPYRPDVWAAEVDVLPSAASLVAGLDNTT